MRQRIGLAMVLVPFTGLLSYGAISAGWPDGLYVVGIYAWLACVGVGIILALDGSGAGNGEDRSKA